LQATEADTVLPWRPLNIVMVNQRGHVSVNVMDNDAITRAVGFAFRDQVGPISKTLKCWSMELYNAAFEPSVLNTVTRRVSRLPCARDMEGVYAQYVVAVVLTCTPLSPLYSSGYHNTTDVRFHTQRTAAAEYAKAVMVEAFTKGECEGPYWRPRVV